MRRYPITPAGQARMRAELRHLIEVERPACIRAIEVARAHGDLSENSEYDDAKHRQGLAEGKIADLKGRLAAAQVIEPTSLSGDRVMFGATVKLEDIDTDEELKYQLVGTYEADLKVGRISVESPIGKALLGKEVGDEVTIRVPKGKRVVEILDVQYI